MYEHYPWLWNKYGVTHRITLTDLVLAVQIFSMHDQSFVIQLRIALARPIMGIHLRDLFRYGQVSHTLRNLMHGLLSIDIEDILFLR